MRIEFSAVGSSLVILVGGPGRPRRVHVERSWPASVSSGGAGERRGRRSPDGGVDRGAATTPVERRVRLTEAPSRRRSWAAGRSHVPDDDHAATTPVPPLSGGTLLALADGTTVAASDPERDQVTSSTRSGAPSARGWRCRRATSPGVSSRTRRGCCT